MSEATRERYQDAIRRTLECLWETEGGIPPECKAEVGTLTRAWIALFERHPDGRLKRTHTIATIRHRCATLLYLGVPSDEYGAPRTQFSYAEIGEILEYADHTTARYAVENNRRAIKTVLSHYTVKKRRGAHPLESPRPEKQRLRTRVVYPPGAEQKPIEIPPPDTPPQTHQPQSQKPRAINLLRERQN